MTPASSLLSKHERGILAHPATQSLFALLHEARAPEVMEWLGEQPRRDPEEEKDA